MQQQAFAVERPLARPMWQRTAIKTIGELAKHFVLVPLAIIFMIPFFWMLSTSLKPDAQIFKWPPVWIPSPIQWSNYVDAVTTIPFFHYVWNTLIICGLSMLGVTFASPPVAYSFSRLRWVGRDFLFIVTIATMMIPYQVTMIPVFLIWANLGFINTFVPLIAPHWLGTPFYIFLLRQFFLSIPFELSDAAKIDGATELGIYRRIILPLAKPALATVLVFEFLNRWRGFIGPLIYLNDQKKYTISLGLQMYQQENYTEWSQLMAASIMLTMPVIILYFFAQRTFIQGITMTGIKG
ncbi:MAG: carbohydrate ABC transporter permease [Chloroflexota bacterium]|nr:carbohydrate ABC transporter permease [Chloroflexota bacterium]